MAGRRYLAAMGLAIAVAAVAQSSGIAQPAPASGSPARYEMKEAPGGVLRLDRQTGAMSFCSQRDGSWSCQAVVDDQKTLREEVQRLEKQVAELKAENRRLEDVLGLGEAPKNGERPGDRPGGKPGLKLQLPTEEDVDKALTYLQRLFKKFRDKIREFDDSEPKGTPL